MIIDYCEQEIVEEKMLVHIGFQFEDEPDSLYVAELSLDNDGYVSAWTLFFNGFDCKYTFRQEEKEHFIHYAQEQGISIRQKA
ncbi:hypothetical protein GK047_09160 [Paenibacillus sp. SYP-B3998]|uniref:Uncharacterized protein n=1 Tax=Paenibacillus sp. SYP-B3998 TaxID=2678564 RepID=A0A6G3ZVV4_9BACL|nr:hypothetical protein [Paenibacillus sp. SYP-B3998]NEW06178.1 hypothetical protein [Paenibacillus sp. SYP-B3998]